MACELVHMPYSIVSYLSMELRYHQFHFLRTASALWRDVLAWRICAMPQAGLLPARRSDVSGDIRPRFVEHQEIRTPCILPRSITSHPHGLLSPEDAVGQFSATHMCISVRILYDRLSADEDKNIVRDKTCIPKRFEEPPTMTKIRWCPSVIPLIDSFIREAIPEIIIERIRIIQQILGSI